MDEAVQSKSVRRVRVGLRHMFPRLVTSKAVGMRFPRKIESMFSRLSLRRDPRRRLMRQSLPRKSVISIEGSVFLCPGPVSGNTSCQVVSLIRLIGEPMLRLSFVQRLSRGAVVRPVPNWNSYLPWAPYSQGESIRKQAINCSFFDMHWAFNSATAGICRWICYPGYWLAD